MYVLTQAAVQELYRNKSLKLAKFSFTSGIGMHNIIGISSVLADKSSEMKYGHWGI